MSGPHDLRNPEGLLPGQGFSHVCLPAAGQTVYLAGQTAHERDGSIASGAMADQVGVALRNLATALVAAGAEPSHLVAMQLFVTDVAAYRDAMDEIGAAWREHLGKHFPTVSLFGVTELFDPAAKVEIVATAVIPD